MIYDDDNEEIFYGEQISFDWVSDLADAMNASSKKKRDKDGCFCDKCKEFYPYAEPNQANDTLICYSCRHPW
jgi:formylmethanofuran dehydrogenase subunit E